MQRYALILFLIAMTLANVPVHAAITAVTPSPRATVAGPYPATDEPVYRPLRTVRRCLTDGPVILAGPNLPTETPGPYTVRLRIGAPELRFGPPAIHYFVGEGKK